MVIMNPASVPPQSMPIWVLVFPGFQLLDACGPVQVFATANDEAAERGQPAPYRPRLVSLDGGSVASSSGVALHTQRLPGPASLGGATVLVAGGAGVAQAVDSAGLIRWLARAASQVRRCGSVCTGAFLLARAGLLDGRRAVTHWRDVATLRQLHPAVDVQDDAIYLRDGHFYTSAGVTAGIDLCLSLVEEDLGRALALDVAKRLVVPLKRPGGQRQFSAELLAQADDSGVLATLTPWLKPRLHRPLGVADMAQAVALSPRTLHRRLREEAGTTPAALLARLRLEAACRLLEADTASLKQVVRQTGFGTPYNLRRAFVRQLGVLPGDYRARFG